MFVQYSFVHVRPKTEPIGKPMAAPSASLVVWAGIAGMFATACAFLWG